MAQSKKTDTSTRKPLIPEKWQDAAYLSLLVILVLVFFWKGIFGGTIIPHDRLASYSFVPVYEQAAEEGVYPLWTPHIFGGMPGFSAFTLNADRPWNLFYFLFLKVTKFIGTLLDNDIARIASYYMIMVIGMFYLGKQKLQDRFLAFIVSAALVFSTGVIVWGMIGHNTKIVAFSMLPFMFIFVERLRKRFRLLDFALLIIITHILFSSNHVQMIFYSGLALGLYLIFELISRTISKKQPMGVVRAGGLLAVAAILAFFMASDKYFSVFDYTPSSTRGAGSIVQVEDSKVSKDGGNDYDYATGWSFSPGEMIDFIVPNYHGFGQLNYSGPATRGEEVKLPTYWGQKPFEDVAPYMGIFVFLFAIYGFIRNRKDIFVQFLMFLSCFALLLSFGYTFPILYDFFYYNVPAFNKFRAPSMSLALMHFAFPIMAGYGIKSLLDPKNKGDFKKLFIAAGVFLLAGIIVAVGLKNSVISAMSASKNSYFAQYAQQIGDLKEFVFGAMISDWFIGALLLIITISFVWAYSKKKLSVIVFSVLILTVLLIDLWRVDYRRFEVQEKISLEEQFPRTDVVKFLQNDKDIFRIADLTSKGGSNYWAYHNIQNIGGYSSAKMRSWQNMSDVAGNGSTGMLANQFIWNIMNVKYILSDRPIGEEPLYQSQSTRTYIYGNPAMMERATFVNSVETATDMEILDKFKAMNFNPFEVAYVENDLEQKIDAPSEGAYAKVTEYKMHNIKFDVNATGNNLLFISEMYYPNWKAYLDGNEIDIIRTNYAFRSVIVPTGKHVLEMKYIDQSFNTGKTISWILSFLVLGGLITGIWLDRKDKQTT